MEWKLFETTSYVSTEEYHRDRARAPHLEQTAHRHRLLAARELIRTIPGGAAMTVSDLGCGDGGLLQLLGEDGLLCWGYDFCPANEQGWDERGVVAKQANWLNECRVGNIVVMTEVLEHLENPHTILAKLAQQPDLVGWLVCSSPVNETDQSHAEEHAWAWDFDGYEKLVRDAGWTIVDHQLSDWSQLILARVP